MNKRELIADVLKRRPEAESALEYLDDAGKIFDAEEEIGEAADDPVGYLVKEIDKLRAAAAKHDTGYDTPDGGVPYSQAFGYITDHERERLEARVEALAKHAAADKSVRAFRTRFTGGEPLEKQRAEAFADSPAAANLPTHWFEENGVPFVDHDARLLSVESKGRAEVVKFVVDPPGATFRVERGAGMPEYEELLVKGGRRFKQPGVTTYVRSNSPLDELRKVGWHLSKQYAGWKHNYATRFVLTGEPPEESSLWSERGPSGEIVMHVAPWISPETVKNAYMHELWFRSWMGERYSGHKAKWRRRLSDKYLKLLRFVTDRIDSYGQRPKGREVVAEWDTEYPQWAYRGNTRTMWRDYNRALQRVAPTAAKKRDLS